MEKYSEVADSLLRIEIELRRLSVWSDKLPPADALQSAQPFCIDTLEFVEWLQFVFLPKMKVLVEQGQCLPAVSGMAPMAEEYFQGKAGSGEVLIRELQVIDCLLSGQV
ncbi:YqcC family protein [Marinobacter changyiensis]|uniref:YqcC family protein n=1 Tax=Marinobacter changyiensis TaxID=2604091 RepID=UPI00126571B5|nr:YqcC family protein [Marinobacter changyiensis]